MSGVQAMLLATFLFSAMNVCVKYVSHLPVLEIVFFRSLFSLCITVFYLWLKKISIRGKNYGWLVLRGIAGTGSLVLHFFTLQKIHLASATTLQFLSPIFSAILGVWILRERLRKTDYLFFLISFLGVVILSGFDVSIRWYNAALGVFSAMLAGLAYNSIRKVKDSEHPMVVVLFFPLVALPVTGFYTIFNFVLPSLKDFLFLLAIGLITQMAQYFMALAYQKEAIAKVAILRYLGIIYAIFFGYFLFDEKLNFLSLVGIVLVLLGVGGKSLERKQFH
ncbi:MAG: DMT family transporter [Bacteroidia bacterium]|nr:DMT family transporter [Bacteroidia bacterium]MDW8159351.1 DMT family transporter [Bacteroidia bacterium]